jgi:uncharacterized sulfatase
VESNDAMTKRPNVVLVFIDDMGWADFSCFGNEDAQTPHADALCEEGIAFEQFYVNSPICSPSRTAISTGTYPQRWGITSFLCGRQSNKDRHMVQWLDPQAPMLARSLKDAGYATGQFGKWHMGGQRDVTEAPPITEYGFDESLTNFEGIGAKLLPLTETPDGEIGKLWEHGAELGEPVTWMKRYEITGGFVDAAISFIDKAREDGKPFYINLWPDDVHSPYWPPPDKWGDGSTRARYLGVLESMDEQLGKLYDTIKADEALRDNTLILVCSDNGPDPGAGDSRPFKGHKTMLYEGGIRSPLVVWGPGVMEKSAIGTRNKESIFSAIDLVPSLVRFCGASKPDGTEYDGEDLLDALLGKSAVTREKPTFFSRPPDRKSFYGIENLPDLAVRHGKWKLLCDYDGSRPELYDLDTDPGESKNLARMQPEVVTDLVEQASDWWQPVKETAVVDDEK